MTLSTSDFASRFKRPLLVVMAPIYVLAGVMHFISTKTFARIVPPQLPRPTALVYLSGIAEIALGIGVLVRRTRNRSAWGLVALLIAVFPANVYMAIDETMLEAVPDRVRTIARVALWLRLPLQGVLLIWAWWYTRPMPDGDD